MEDERAVGEPVRHRAAVERFAEQLRTLRATVGNPSFRKMAGRSGRISHTTLHEAAAGARFPSWETTREFVRACEADEAQWRRRWEDARRAGAADGVPDGERSPADIPAAIPETTAATSVTSGGSETRGTSTDVVAAGPLGAVSTTADGEQVMPAAATTDLVPASRPQPVANVWGGAPGTRRFRPWWLVAAGVLVVAMVAALGITIRARSRDGSGASPTSPTASPTASSDSLVAGDASKFVADITIPDGTQVKVNAQFTKVWAIANVGTVGWHNRFLARTNPGDDESCRTPDRVPIGDTLPGEQAMISVPVTAPSRPGRCWVSWKMVDAQGRPFFPSRRPVYFLVNVVR